MRCVVCHYVEQEARKSNAHLHKHFNTYNKNHETIAMTRHVFTKHSTILNMYKTQKQLATTDIHLDAQQSSNKQKKLIAHSSVKFFCFGILYKKFDLAQEQFLQDLYLYIIKRYCPLNSMKNIWPRNKFSSNVEGLCFQIGGNFAIKWYLPWSIKPWNVMLFLALQNPPQLL